MEPDLNEKPIALINDLHEAAHRQDHQFITRTLSQLSLIDLLEALQHTQNANLQTIMFVQVEQLIKRQPLEDAYRMQLLQWLIQQVEELLIIDSSIAKQAFRHLFGTAVALLCRKGEDFTRMMQELASNLESNQIKVVEALNLFQAVVVAAEENPQAKFVRSLESSFLNSFVYIAYKQLNQCTAKLDNNDQVWHWNGDILMTTASLKLLLACLNYDFFGNKKNNQTSEFAQDRSPILIPCRPSKYENFKCYESLRELTMLNLLSFLHETAESIEIRCLCLEMLCDLSRIQMRLFKSQQSFVDFSNELVSSLDDIAKFLRLDTAEDYTHVLCYFTNINKCLTMLSFNRMNYNLLREWLLNLLDFCKGQLLLKTVLPPTLVKPLFTFLAGFEKVSTSSKALYETAKHIIGEFVVDYTSCLLRVTDARAYQRQPGTDIVPILLSMEPDPFLHLNLMEDYLHPYKTFEMQLPTDLMNYEEMLWTLYMRFEYLNDSLEKTVARNDEEKMGKVKRLREQLADCVSGASQLREFWESPRYNISFVRFYYAYVMSKLQHSNQIVELIRGCGLPIVPAAHEIIALGREFQQLAESCLYLVYLSAVERDELYETFVSKINQLKKKKALGKELTIWYKYCFLLATDGIIRDVLNFIGEDFRLEIAVDLLYLTRKYEMHGKYRPLLECTVRGGYLPSAVNLIEALSNAQQNDDALDIAYNTTLAVHSILKVDAVNRCERTNKLELCRLLIPITWTLVKSIGHFVYQRQNRPVADRIPRMYIKLVYVLRRLLELSYLQIKQLCLDPAMDQIRTSVFEIMHVSTEMTLDKWPVQLLQLCDNFYRNEQHLFQYDVHRKYFLILLRFLPTTQQQILQLIGFADQPEEFVHLMLQAIDQDEDSVHANEVFLQQYLNNSNFDVSGWVQHEAYSQSLLEVLRRVMDRRDIQTRYANAKIPEYVSVVPEEQTKHNFLLHIDGVEVVNSETLPTSSKKNISFINVSHRISDEQAKDMMPDIVIQSNQPRQ